MIAETDFTSGPPTLHPKAIYIVEGRLFQVERLDFDGRKAYVKRSRLRLLHRRHHAHAGHHPRSVRADATAVSPITARCTSCRAWSGFKKIKFYTNENVGSGELDLPEQQMHTTSYWLEIPLDVLAALPYATDDRRDGIFGLAFAMKQIATLLLMCDGHDLGLSINAGRTMRGRGSGRDRARGWRYAAHLHLRRLSWRHRLQRAAVLDARRVAGADARS